MALRLFHPRRTALFAGTLALVAVPIAMIMVARATNEVPTAPTVVQAAYLTPTMTMSIHNAEHEAVTSVVIGTSVHVRVRINGSATTPTGEVKVTWYRSSDCVADFDGSATLALTNGLAHFVAANRPFTVGTHSVKVAYLGSGLYNAIGVCRKLTVTKATPRVFISLHDNAHAPLLAAVAGQQVHAKATVTSDLVQKPTGSFRYVYASEADCGPSVTYDTQSFGVETTTVESDRISFDKKSVVYFQVIYSGDEKYRAAKSSCFKLTVNGARPTLTLEVHKTDHTSTIAALYINTVVHPFVRVTGSVGTPTGVIQLWRYANDSCAGEPTVVLKSLNGGVFDAAVQDADFPSTEPAPADISWQVRYGGDATYASRVGACDSLHWRAPVTALIDAHNAAHAPLDTFAAGTPVHVLVGLSGSFGTVTGTAEIRTYGNGSCSADPQVSDDLPLAEGVVDSGLFTRTRSTTGQISFQVIYRSASGSETYMSRGFPCYAVSFIGPTVTAKPTATPTPRPTAGAGSTAAPTGAPAATEFPGETLQPAPSASPAPGEPSGPPAATSPPSGTPTITPPGAGASSGVGATPRPEATSEGLPAGDSGSGGFNPLFVVAFIIVAFLVAGSFYLGRRGQRRPSR